MPSNRPSWHQLICLRAWREEEEEEEEDVFSCNSLSLKEPTYAWKPLFGHMQSSKTRWRLFSIKLNSPWYCWSLLRSKLLPTNMFTFSVVLIFNLVLLAGFSTCFLQLPLHSLKPFCNYTVEGAKLAHSALQSLEEFCKIERRRQINIPAGLERRCLPIFSDPRWLAWIGHQIWWHGVLISLQRGDEENRIYAISKHAREVRLLCHPEWKQQKARFSRFHAKFKAPFQVIRWVWRIRK